MNTPLSIDEFADRYIKPAVEAMMDNFSQNLDALFALYSSTLRVWDGDNYFACERLVDEDGEHKGRVQFVCGKCRDAMLSGPGDVCFFCFSVAVGEEKIGETINVRRPQRFGSAGRGGGKTAKVATFPGVKY